MTLQMPDGSEAIHGKRRQYRLCNLSSAHSTDSATRPLHTFGPGFFIQNHQASGVSWHTSIYPCPPPTTHSPLTNAHQSPLPCPLRAVYCTQASMNPRLPTGRCVLKSCVDATTSSWIFNSPSLGARYDISPCSAAMTRGMPRYCSCCRISRSSCAYRRTSTSDDTQ